MLAACTAGVSPALPAQLPACLPAGSRVGLGYAIQCSPIRLMQVLPMNTGVEGGETAIKLARRWGYDVKVGTHVCTGKSSC